MSEVHIQGGSSVPDALPLKFDLEVLASAFIKCRKPWSGLAFLGEVSLFLFVSVFASLCMIHTFYR